MPRYTFKEYIPPDMYMVHLEKQHQIQATDLDIQMHPLPVVDECLGVHLKWTLKTYEHFQYNVN